MSPPQCLGIFRPKNKSTVSARRLGVKKLDKQVYEEYGLSVLILVYFCVIVMRVYIFIYHSIHIIGLPENRVYPQMAI